MFSLNLSIFLLFVLVVNLLAEEKDKVAEKFSYPLANYFRVEQDFWDLLYDKNAYHLGEDAYGNPGDIVLSIADGYVEHAAHHPPRTANGKNYGGMVIIESELFTGETITHFYAHGGKKR